MVEIELFLISRFSKTITGRDINLIPFMYIYIYIDIICGEGARPVSFARCSFGMDLVRCPKNLISLEKPLCKRPRSLTRP